MIIAQAGHAGRVTVATNMAGRGVDIILGGNPEFEGKQEALAQGLVPESPEFDEFVRDVRAGQEGRVGAGAREGRRRRRPVRDRHRATRVTPHRQPAPRTFRTSGRPRRVALLPVPRRRAHAAVRRRPPADDHGPPQAPRGPADRGEDGHARDRARAEQRRAAELPDPQGRPRLRRGPEHAADDHLRRPHEAARRRGLLGAGDAR